ncbi:MAG: hypothetical protein RL318_761, partial [Fibrobacterota bacterium]
MLLIPLLLSLSSGLFDVPDTSAWKIQTDARVTATSSLPGADGFYPAPGSSNGTQLLSTDAGASAGGLQLRIAV